MCPKHVKSKVEACCAATCVECMSIVNERHESKACQMHVSNICKVNIKKRILDHHQMIRSRDQDKIVDQEIRSLIKR